MYFFRLVKLREHDLITVDDRILREDVHWIQYPYMSKATSWLKKKILQNFDGYNIFNLLIISSTFISRKAGQVFDKTNVAERLREWTSW